MDPTFSQISAAQFRSDQIHIYFEADPDPFNCYDGNLTIFSIKFHCLGQTDGQSGL